MPPEAGQFPYVLSYTMRRIVRNDYKRQGQEPLRILLNDGEVITLWEVLDHQKLEQAGIRLDKTVTRESSDTETATVEVHIHGPQALPLTVEWADEDIYTAKGCGTSGFSQKYAHHVAMAANGKVCTDREKLPPYRD